MFKNVVHGALASALNWHQSRPDEPSGKQPSPSFPQSSSPSGFGLQNKGRAAFTRMLRDARHSLLDEKSGLNSLRKAIDTLKTQQPNSQALHSFQRASRLLLRLMSKGEKVLGKLEKWSSPPLRLSAEEFQKQMEALGKRSELAAIFSESAMQTADIPLDKEQRQFWQFRLARKIATTLSNVELSSLSPEELNDQKVRIAEKVTADFLAKKPWAKFGAITTEAAPSAERAENPVPDLVQERRNHITQAFAEEALKALETLNLDISPSIKEFWRPKLEQNIANELNKLDPSKFSPEELEEKEMAIATDVAENFLSTMNKAAHGATEHTPSGSSTPAFTPASKTQSDTDATATGRSAFLDELTERLKEMQTMREK